MSALAHDARVPAEVLDPDTANHFDPVCLNCGAPTSADVAPLEADQ